MLDIFVGNRRRQWPRRRRTSRRRRADARTIGKKNGDRKRTGRPLVVVAGDVTIDWFGVNVPPVNRPADGSLDGPPSWRLLPGTSMFAKPGGALLLCRMLQAMTAREPSTHCLENIENVPPEEVVHSIAELSPFPVSVAEKNAKKLTYRVRRFGGFSGASDRQPRLLKLIGDDRAADVVVLDDAGHGFRKNVSAWPKALTDPGSRPVVILKMSCPIGRGSLWELICGHQRHAPQTVVVVSANDLRADGANISRQLSWERSATDLLWQLASNPTLVYLTNCRHVVVHFGMDAVVHVQNLGAGIEASLHYDPTGCEGGFRDDHPGDMMGINSAFVAALAARVIQDGLDAVADGVDDGLRAARRLFRHGFGREVKELDYPVHTLDGPTAPAEKVREDAAPDDVAREEMVFARVLLPSPGAAALRKSWSILRETTRSLEDAAYDIVLRGDALALPQAPVGRFRDLRTADRNEIEGYRSMRNLIREYLLTAKPKRPLCIAVFGPPGAGKSYGVTEVAESVAASVKDGIRIDRLEFNLSQFRSPQQLVGALHRVRDSALAGSIPLVFFDEFDATLESSRLGWLRYLLAPMQDGVFNDGEAVHLVGKAIFVFAGGTSGTFRLFVEGVDGSGQPVSKRRLEEHATMFREAKGPDFVSRLRGYVDILGPNAVGDDEFFMVRRAMILRSLLERKAKHLIEPQGRALIDPGVLRAFIKTAEYKHGVRSMEAIIDMSMLAGRASFEQAALPSEDQLKLHVTDAAMFCQHVVRDVLLGAARERLAQAIHARFQADHKSERRANDASMRPWRGLLEHLKESNRQQADHIPVKLRRVHCGFEPAGDDAQPEVTFTDQEVEILAEMEHDRFVAERRQAQWTESRRRNPAAKKTPYLVPWSDLTKKIKDYDRKAVRAIPELMRDAGFNLYRIR